MHTILLSYIVVLQLFRLSLADLTMYFHGVRRSNETAAHFDCRLSDAPVGDTVEFLVNDITAFNIRIYGDDCYVTDSQHPCDGTKCECTPDGKRYKWVYHHTANIKYKAACRANIKNGCFVKVEVTMDADVDQHNLNTRNCNTPIAKPKPTTAEKNPTSSLSMIKGNGFLIESCLVAFCWLNHRQTQCFNYFLVALMYLSMTKASVEQPNVILTVKYKKDHVELACKVRNLVNEVYFHDPKGHQRGFCTAPVPTIAPGECEKYMTQNIDDNLTTLVISVTKEDDGMWICLHGMNTHETAYASVDVDQEGKTTDDCLLNPVPWLGGIVIGIVLTVVAAKGVPSTKKRCQRLSSDSTAGDMAQITQNEQQSAECNAPANRSTSSNVGSQIQQNSNLEVFYDNTSELSREDESKM